MSGDEDWGEEYDAPLLPPGDPRMCTAGDLTGEECQRVARWEWRPDDEHPVWLCNFHAEPFIEPAPAARVREIPS